MVDKLTPTDLDAIEAAMINADKHDGFPCRRCQLELLLHTHAPALVASARRVAELERVFAEVRNGVECRCPDACPADMLASHDARYNNPLAIRLHAADHARQAAEREVTRLAGEIRLAASQVIEWSTTAQEERARAQVAEIERDTLAAKLESMDRELLDARRVVNNQQGDNTMNATPTPEHIMQFFAYAHLPEHLQSVSAPFARLAELIEGTLPRNPERTVALRKLLEAKDAAIRAALAK